MLIEGTKGKGPLKEMKYKHLTDCCKRDLHKTNGNECSCRTTWELEFVLEIQVFLETLTLKLMKGY